MTGTRSIWTPQDRRTLLRLRRRFIAALTTTATLAGLFNADWFIALPAALIIAAFASFITFRGPKHGPRIVLRRVVVLTVVLFLFAALATGVGYAARAVITSTTGVKLPNLSVSQCRPGTANGMQPDVAQFAETPGGDAHTWTDFGCAAGIEGPTIPRLTSLHVSCAVRGFEVSDGDSWWYRIADSPWNGQYFVSADAFYNNGMTSGSLRGTPFVDPKVPICR